MAVRREKSDQRQQAAQDQGDPTLDVEQKNLPTPSNRRSVHNTPVLLNGEGRPWCSAEFAVFEKESDQPSELLGVFWGGGELVLELNKSTSILELSSSSRSISFLSCLIRCS